MANVTLTERDLKILRYLWRWKVLSTAALTEKFFPERSPITAYTRLWHLQDGNYIRLIPLSDGKRFVWGLDQKGLASIKNQLPDLREIGFKSENVEHDHLVSAIHIGEWLTTTTSDDYFFSEQELRRFHLDQYPEWVP